MKGTRNKGNRYVEDYAIEFESDEVIKERVLKNDFKKIYSLKDISRWVEYGLRNGVIKRSPRKEDVELLMQWIDLLDGKNVSL